MQAKQAGEPEGAAGEQGLELDEIEAARRFVEAEARMSRALDRLCRAEIEAPAEAHSGGERFDTLIQEFRAARRDAEALRVTWQRSRARRLDTAPAAPLEVTPRMLFARWLYRQGRILG
jgi:hypothetical protein